MARSTKEILEKMKTAEIGYSRGSSLSAHRGIDVTYVTEYSPGSSHLRTGSSEIPSWLSEQVGKLKQEEYERGKKEALQKIWDLIPNDGQTTFLLNQGHSIITTKPSDGVVDPGGRKVIVTKDYLFSNNDSEEASITSTIPSEKLQIGWYQDEQAELYYYEGENHWKETTLAKSKELTEEAIIGKLEYIG